MENLYGIIFVFGAAIVVAIIIFADLYKRKIPVKPYAKWLTVFLLSIWQAGCWRALNGFDTAFGNSSKLAVYEIVFAAIVVAWFVYQILQHRKHTSETDKNE